jgi:Mn-dependent DtxR family transcriptional regulator
MLKIFNDLSPFFKDNYERIHIREYARIRKISPPTASKRLNQLNKQGLLNKEEERNIIFYYANKDSKEFIDLSRIYWRQQLTKKGLIKHLTKELINPLIILFGSFSKVEIKKILILI